MDCEHQAPPSSAISQSLFKFMFIEPVMLPSYLILYHLLLLLPCLSQHWGLFQWVSSSHQVAKVLEFQLHHQFFQWMIIFQLKKTGAGECGIDKMELGQLSSGWNARHQPVCMAEILQTLSAVRREHLIIFNRRAGECVLTQVCFLTLPMDGQLDQLWTNVHTEVEQIWKGQEKLMSHKIYPETACKWVWHSFSL